MNKRRRMIEHNLAGHILTIQAVEDLLFDAWYQSDPPIRVGVLSMNETTRTVFDALWDEVAEGKEPTDAIARITIRTGTFDVTTDNTIDDGEIRLSAGGEVVARLFNSQPTINV